MASDVSSDATPRGKQIVFLFMAATVVAVVVFLCGVFVGRGVPRGGLTGAGVGGPVIDEYAVDDLPPPTLSTPSAEPSAGAAASDDLSYPDRLTGSDPEADRIGSTAPVADIQADERRDAPGEVDPAPRRASSEPASARADATPARAGTGGEGFTVQVTANRGRAAARVVADQLRSKGFPAFVLEPSADDPVPFHRVRVGPYQTREEARRIRDRLTDEEAMSGAYISP